MGFPNLRKAIRLSGDLGSVPQFRQRVDQRIDLMFKEADIALAEGDGLYPRNFGIRDERIGGAVKAVVFFKLAVAATESLPSLLRAQD